MELILPSIGLELTDRCNFDCIHCYVPGKNRNRLNLDDVKKLIPILKELEYLKIYLTGGEPFLPDTFPDIYEHLRCNGFIVTIMSNGSFLTKDAEAVLLKRPPHRMEISIYGMGNQTYERVVKRSNVFDAVKQNLAKLQKAGINMLLKYVLLKENETDLPLFLEFCEKINLAYTVTPALFPIIKDNQLECAFRIEPATLKEIIGQYHLPFKNLHQAIVHECDAGESLYITADLKIKGCPVLNDSFRPASHSLAKEDLLKAAEIFKERYYRNPTYEFCPAWAQREGQEEIKKYLGKVGEIK